MNRKQVLLALVAIALICGGAGAAYGWISHWSPAAKSQAVVKRKLFDPDSAQFRAHFPAARGGAEVWCGEVNARNRLGGMVGYTRYVATIDESLADIPGADPDGLSTVKFDDDSDGFRNKWNLMCTGQ